MKKLFLGAASVFFAAMLICAPMTEASPMNVSAAINMHGDFNGDNKVNPIDLAILARHLAGWNGYEVLVDTSVADLTTFVITATPKQYYFSGYTSSNDVGKTMVGMQTLVNGVPSGSMVYVPCEDLGIDPANVEDYFHYSVELTNFNPDDNSFDSARFCTEPVVLTHNDVSVSAPKFSVNGVKYTPVAAVTGSSLLNEVVLYDTMDIAYGSAKMLPTNADGDIINPQGEVIAVFAYESSSGAKYYYDQIGGSVITEAQALNNYGVYVQNGESSDLNYVGGVTSQAEVKAMLQNTAFELVAFDDNSDGLYDRMFYSPIYMGVYYTYNANNKTYDGLIKEGFGIAAETKNVTYTDEAAANLGEVIVYTYNKQLNKVTVKDTVEMQTGYIDKVDATLSTKDLIKVTIDGTQYRIGYKSGNADNLTDGKVMGAHLIEYDAAADAKRAVEDVATRPFIQYIQSRNNFISTLKIDDYVGFYAYNGIIIYASEMIPEEETYNFAVIDKFTSFAAGGFTANMFVDGEIIEDAPVYKLDGITVSKISEALLPSLINEKHYYYPGNLYAFKEYGDGYNLMEIISPDNYDDYDLIDVRADEVSILEFDAGVTLGDRSVQLRTDDNTVFYFIERSDCSCTPDILTGEHTNECASVDRMNDTVTVFIGQPDAAYIEFDCDSLMFTDKLGYGTGDYNGVAAFVYVYYPVEFVGFEEREEDEIPPAIPASGDRYAFTKASANRVTVCDAKDFGLPEEYKGAYYMYDSVAVDLNTGEIIPKIYSKYKLGGFRIYKFNEDGVVYLDDPLGYKGGALVDDGSHYSSAHWIASFLATSRLQTSRDYAKYGIININSDNRLNINDYKAYLNLNSKELEAQLAKAATELGVDVNSFEAIPDAIEDIDLVNELISARYFDNRLIVDIVNGVTATPLITKDDNVTELVVINNNNLNTVWTGEEAVEILNSAPQVAWIGIKDNANYELAQLFEEYISDGVAVFIVTYDLADK